MGSQGGKEGKLGEGGSGDKQVVEGGWRGGGGRDAGGARIACGGEASTCVPYVITPMHLSILHPLLHPVPPAAPCPAFRTPCPPCPPPLQLKEAMADREARMLAEMAALRAGLLGEGAASREALADELRGQMRDMQERMEGEMRALREQHKQVGGGGVRKQGAASVGRV